VKHRPGRDLAHTRTREFVGERPHRRARAEKGDGTSWPARSLTEGKPPGRPAIGFLYEDLGDMQPVPVFGMYPKHLVRQIAQWLRCERREVLHVCSGGLGRGEGLRMDIRPDARPDVVADGRSLPLRTSSVAAVMIDPPYTEHYAAELYGVEYPRPAHLLAEASRVVRPNGRIAIVHYITPNPPRGCELVKVFGLSVGFGYPMRAVTIYQKAQHGLFPVETSA
jgi:hypothetical protein